MARNANQIGVLNSFGGTINGGNTGNGLEMNWGSNDLSIANLMGGTISFTNATVIMNQANQASSTGIVNVNGGTLFVKGLAGAANGPSYLNFNGGTLKAGQANGTFINANVTTYINSGGGVIDDGGFAITIPTVLRSPTGNGASTAGATLPVLSGLISPPIVTVTRGAGDTNGVDASAIASIDSNGNLTGITLTNAGVNFLTGSAPVFTLSGGGLTNTVTFTGTVAANFNTGILIKNGPEPRRFPAPTLLPVA